ncbi:hypothetical protein TEA_011473 [Camellia sinensis var. sinensis]|uniref:C2 domain-containing protein n=1 Tax=Camellia sinensis var. sinensis TaxID=542762 RepID=A0A4S4DJD7_CAMSN|nr:hypothetical protein TEA_011473 [Camellia sinensis var. sinensis]
MLKNTSPQNFTMEVTVISAEGLKKTPSSAAALFFSRRLRPFVTLTLPPFSCSTTTTTTTTTTTNTNGDKLSHVYKTRIDDQGGINPTWGDKFHIPITDSTFFHQRHYSFIYLQLYNKHVMVGQTQLGWCQIPAADILDGLSPAGTVRRLSYRLRSRDGSRAHGVVNVAVKLEGSVSLTRQQNRDLTQSPEMGLCQPVMVEVSTCEQKVGHGTRLDESNGLDTLMNHYLRGDLCDFLKRKGALKPTTAVIFALDIASGWTELDVKNSVAGGQTNGGLGANNKKQQQQQQQQQQQAAISRFPSNIDAHLRPPGFQQHRPINPQQQQQTPNPNPNPNSNSIPNQQQNQNPNSNPQQDIHSQFQQQKAIRPPVNQAELQMAYQDAWRVCHPDFKRPFSSLEDACERNSSLISLCYMHNSHRLIALFHDSDRLGNRVTHSLRLSRNNLGISHVLLCFEDVSRLEVDFRKAKLIPMGEKEILEAFASILVC